MTVLVVIALAVVFTGAICFNIERISCSGNCTELPGIIGLLRVVSLNYVRSLGQTKNAMNI